MNRISFALTALLLLAGSLYSCNVPVFRYALERWRPDVYEAVVFHDGKVQSSDSVMVQQLADAGAEPYYANMRTSLANVKDSLPDWVRNVWTEQKSPKLPWLVLCLPVKYGHKAVWSGPVTPQAVKQIVQSPIRLEAARRILRGESAVWIMIQSSDRAKDKAVSDSLQKVIAAMNDSLSLPKPDGNLSSYVNVSGKVPLQIKFSALYMSPNDPAEQVFLRMLFNGKDDPSKLAGPAVCLMFGRGRNLDVLTGSQITVKALRQISQFLTGMCSCTIKEQNPGTDMLVAMNWDGGLAGSLSQEPMPELTGMTSMGDPAVPQDTVKAPAGKDSSTQKKTPAKKKK